MSAARQVISRRVRDLGAASAFLAVALSGSLPAWVTTAFVLALGASLLGFRPFARAERLSVLVLLVIAVVLFALSWRGALDLVIAACAFAALIASHRMLADETVRTNRQVHLASLLLVAGGAAISGELWYAPCLLAFAGCAAVSTALDVVDEASFGAEVPLEVVVRPVARGLLFAAVGATAFFVLFPRMSWNVAGRRTGAGLGGVTGMSDRVRLGGGGSIKSSPRVVARVRLSPDPAVESLGRYFVGRVFDTFDGTEWRGSGTPLAPAARVTLGVSGPGMVQQQIELLPAYEARTLIALEAPAIFGQVRAQSTAGSARGLLVHVPDEEVRFADDANAWDYEAWSQPDPAQRPTLLGDLARFTRLPDALDPRVGALARQVAGNAADAVDAAQRLTEHLQGSYAYTLDQGEAAADPLADFLFGRRAGHCEHFATALAVLLRSLGFPARVAAGFYGGERLGEAYLLRAGDAHAWTQVWAPGRGWLTFDATPAEGRAAQPSLVWGAVVNLYERVDAFWRARVVDYSLRDQFVLARALVRQPAVTRGAGQLPGPPPLAWGVAAVVFVAVWALLRRGRPRAERPHAAAGFLGDIEARLAAAHLPYLPGEGLEELAARLRRAQHPLADPVGRASRRYLEARFGARPVDAREQQALLAALAAGARPKSRRGGAPVR